jgi:predicted enzyme related to lactoylglutathione lyase
MFDRFPITAVLPASDLARAKAWYRDTLGLTPSSEDMGGLWYQVAGGTRFLVTPSEYAGTAQNTAASWTVADIESVMATLRERGVVFEEYDMGGGYKTVNGLLDVEGNRAAWFKDSEGNLLEMSQPSSSPTGGEDPR